MKKNKVPMRLRIDLPIFHTAFQMYLSREALLADVDQTGQFGDDTWGACVQVAHTEDGIPFICLAFRDDSFMTTEIIAHECVHAAWAVCDLAGIKLSAKNHEVQAYLTEFFVREVTVYVDAYFQSKKKKGKKK